MMAKRQSNETGTRDTKIEEVQSRNGVKTVISRGQKGKKRQSFKSGARRSRSEKGDQTMATLFLVGGFPPLEDRIKKKQSNRACSNFHQNAGKLAVAAHRRQSNLSAKKALSSNRT